MEAEQQKYCTHTRCRADVVEELRWMSRVLGIPKAFELAAAESKAIASEVRCRQVPRRGGGEYAPLAGDPS